MKILYYINGMHFGGAAKKVAMLSGELSRRGHEVHVATNMFLPIGFKMSPDVHLHSLYPEDSYTRGRVYRLMNVIKNARRIALELRPDVIVSVLPHVSLFVRIAVSGTGIPLVFSDETSFARKDSWVDYLVRRHLYYFADAVTLLTHNDARILGRRIPRKTVIHNPVLTPPVPAGIVREKVILAVGPLFEWDIKGFDLLFDAFSSLKADFPEWKLKIVGAKDAATESKVMDMAAAKSVADRLTLTGFDPDIFNHMRQASVYALTSRIEGFSLSLVEAMSQGCACVAFRSHGVIEEVSQGGKGVVLIDDGDVKGFGEGLRRCMSDSVLRQNMADEGIECSKRYGLVEIANDWEQLFRRLIER